MAADVEHTVYASIIRVDDLSEEPVNERAKHGPMPNQYVLTEKIHGANFSVYVTRETYRLYSRRMAVTPSAKNTFFNISKFIEKKEFQSNIENVMRRVEADDQIDCVRLVGEYFGGKGQVCDDGEICDKGVAVQKDEWVEYCWENRLVIFDVAVRRVRDKSWSYLYYRDARELATSCGFEYVPVVAILSTWNQVRQYLQENPPPDTKSSVRGASHAGIEGYVIRRYIVEEGSEFPPRLFRPILKYTRLSVNKIRC